MASILVIDDDQHIRYLLSALLENAGHHIVEAVNGKKALEALHEHRPSLMIVDIFMPEMDGIELIRKARMIQADLKIIAISGSFSLQDVDVLDAAQQLGATYAVQKPFEIHSLLAMIQGLLPPTPDSAPGE